MIRLNDYQSPIYTYNMVDILNLKDPASFFFLFFSVCLPAELLNVSGPLEWC